MREMLPGEERFLDGLLDQPDDLDLREVYADWLEDQSDPRAELLRLTATLSRLSDTDEHRAGLEARLKGLRETLPWNWLICVDRHCAEEAIQEAVFRNFLGQTPYLPTHFLSVDERQDPSPALLFRLRQLGPGIHPISEGGAEDDLSAYPALTVSLLQWINGRKCAGEVSFVAAPLAGQGLLFTVEWKGNGWVITDLTPTWIS